jgi:predicted metal-binding membrane protein
MEAEIVMTVINTLNVVPSVCGTSLLPGLDLLSSMIALILEFAGEYQSTTIKRNALLQCVSQSYSDAFDLR